jgi:hypothetical protein
VPAPQIAFKTPQIAAIYALVQKRKTTAGDAVRVDRRSAIATSARRRRLSRTSLFTTSVQRMRAASTSLP